MTLETFLARLAPNGLAFRGGFHPEPGNSQEVPQNTRTVLLIGMVGRHGWAEFSASPEFGDGLPDPLDRWSKRLIDALALECQATALYPFGGPPYHPFQRWARRAEPVSASSLGLLIHPRYGLSHSYRGALALREHMDLPAPETAALPCETCLTKPCLSACPAGAFTVAGYDLGACTTHLKSESQSCTLRGCAARLACPIGADFRQDETQIRFHMNAFYASRC